MSKFTETTKNRDRLIAPMPKSILGMRFTIIIWYNSKTYVYEIYEDCSFMNFTFMLLNNKTKSINAELNRINDFFKLTNK